MTTKPRTLHEKPELSVHVGRMWQRCIEAIRAYKHDERIPPDFTKPEMYAAVNALAVEADTNATMYAAWRKRAEEAEAALLEAVPHDQETCPRCGQMVTTMACLKHHKHGDVWCIDSGRNMDAYRELATLEAVPRLDEEENKDFSAQLIHQTIPTIEGTEPRLRPKMDTTLPTPVDLFRVALEGADTAMPVLITMLKTAKLKAGLVVADEIWGNVKCALKVHKEQVGSAPVMLSEASTGTAQERERNDLTPNSATTSTLSPEPDTP